MKSVTEAKTGDVLFCTPCINGGPEYTLDVVSSTEKAIQVRNADRNLTVWIPRSALQVNTWFNRQAKESYGINCCWHSVAQWFWNKANRQQKLALHLICG